MRLCCSTRLILIGLLVFLIFPPWVAGSGPSYDPLRVPPGLEFRTVELNIADQARHRDIPLHVYLPSVQMAAPVVLFSHGLGGSGREYTYLSEHWAKRGYAVILIQHPGSDVSVWQGKPEHERLTAMRQAASLENFLLRVKDVAVTLDYLEKMNDAPCGSLSGRLDLTRVGMSGHSFGAITTQAVSGQNTGMAGVSFIEPRIKAAVIMSPQTAIRVSAATSFGSVGMPWMLMTGTHDLVPALTDTDMAARLGVFPALPPGGKYEVVFFNAEHSVFTDRVLPGDSRPRNPNHHRAILALTTAFWDVRLRNDQSAKTWLDGDGPRGVLEKQDNWRRK
jgi:predicted dienelactone hydrolase